MSASGFDFIGRQTNEWACLPAGPLERQFRKGVQWGIGEEVHTEPSRRRGIPFLVGFCFEVASACYPYRCRKTEKVAFSQVRKCYLFFMPEGETGGGFA
ncbi:MAG: hypothetical protein WCA89_06810, partial [Terracidiphilus sp.]